MLIQMMIFWIWHPKQRQSKKSKWDYINLNSFCPEKFKNQQNEKAGYLVGYLIISKTYKDLIQLDKRKPVPFEKWEEDLWIDFFPQILHTDVQQVHGKMLNISNLQGNHIRTTMSYHLTCQRLLSGRQAISSVSGDAEKGALCTVRANVG